MIRPPRCRWGFDERADTWDKPARAGRPAISATDAIGYTGSAGVQLFKDLAQSGMSRLGFFKGFTYFMSILGVVCLVGSCLYFLRRDRSDARPD